MASPATIEVTRIAATPPGKLPDFVNRFTSPQTYSATPQMEEGRVSLNQHGIRLSTDPSFYLPSPSLSRNGHTVPISACDITGRVLRGRHHVARSRGDLAPRPYRAHHLSRALGR